MSAQEWNEAREEQLPSLRWEEQAKAGDNGKTVYLGAVVQGIYIARKDDVGANKAKLYTIDVPEIGKVVMWGSQVIDARMAQVPLNMEVRISFLGMQPPKIPGHRPWYNFKVEYAKPVTQMVDAEAVAAETILPGVTPGGTGAPAAPGQAF